jgi:hypothetical protein
LNRLRVLWCGVEDEDALRALEFSLAEPTLWLSIAAREANVFDGPKTQASTGPSVEHDAPKLVPLASSTSLLNVLDDSAHRRRAPKRLG